MANIDRKSNLRSAQVSTSSGSDVKTTDQLKGEASITKAEKETNQTTEMTTSGQLGGGGPYGGEASHK